MQVGELYRFEGGYCPMKWYGKVAVYLGEDFIHRDDGVTVENHKIIVQGEETPRIIDRGCLKWLCKLTK